MMGVELEQIKIIVGKLLDCGGKTGVTFPETWGGVMDQSFLHWPAP